ncbi:hypothetical protein BC835DRAFT_1345982 [Cytidiella melzeri]|nr:hypothetical protein BC835DRAFT_1345982 [Cytidiella melzeri]
MSHASTFTALLLMDLPDEVHLAIQSHMTVSSLLISRAVCRLWHSLIPGSHIPPARLRLIHLYLRLVYSPAFHATRKDTLSRLQPFDAGRALSMIAKGGVQVPEEFRVWLLEWPARAAFAGIWPGLRFQSDLHADAASNSAEESLQKTGRTSLLNSDKPYILNQLEVTSHSDSENPVTMRVSPPWASVPPSNRAVALVLDSTYFNGWQRSNMLVLSAPDPWKELIGRVYLVDGLQTRADHAFAHSWVDYLLQELEREEKRV